LFLYAGHPCRLKNALKYTLTGGDLGMLTRSSANRLNRRGGDSGEPVIAAAQPARQAQGYPIPMAF
jgi:hypothetical protein